MTWIKLDDNACDHPKIAALSDKTFRWWVRSLSYASRYLTDGALPKVFWKQVPNSVRHQLVEAKLWDWIDPHFVIHDYAHHQSLKADVEADKARNRKKAAEYRAKRRADRDRVPGDVTGDVPGTLPGREGGDVTNPENREQRTPTENRAQRTEKTTTTPLILSPLQYERLKETHAYIGTVLRVPKVLHAELRTKSGIADAEGKLQAWYAHLDADLEQSGKGTGDVFAWLRPRHQAYAIEQGWIEAAPRPGAPARPKPRGVAEILADQRRPA